MILTVHPFTHCESWQLLRVTVKTANNNLCLKFSTRLQFDWIKKYRMENKRKLTVRLFVICSVQFYKKKICFVWFVSVQNTLYYYIPHTHTLHIKRYNMKKCSSPHRRFYSCVCSHSQTQTIADIVNFPFVTNKSWKKEMSINIIINLMFACENTI